MAKPVGWAHETANGWVVSKTPLTPDSVPVHTETAIRDALERVRSRLGDKGYKPAAIYNRALDALEAELLEGEE